MEAVENFTLPRLADLGIKETERKTQQAKPKNNPAKKTNGKVNVSAEDAYDTAYDHTQRFDIMVPSRRDGALQTSTLAAVASGFTRL